MTCDRDRLRACLKAFDPAAPSSTAAQIAELRIGAREFGCPEMGKAADALALKHSVGSAALAMIETAPERYARERFKILAEYEAQGGDAVRGAARLAANKLSIDPNTRAAIERRINRCRGERKIDTVRNGD